MRIDNSSLVGLASPRRLGSQMMPIACIVELASSMRLGSQKMPAMPERHVKSLGCRRSSNTPVADHECAHMCVCVMKSWFLDQGPRSYSNRYQSSCPCDRCDRYGENFRHSKSTLSQKVWGHVVSKQVDEIRILKYTRTKGPSKDRRGGIDSPRPRRLEDEGHKDPRLDQLRDSSECLPFKLVGLFSLLAPFRLNPVEACLLPDETSTPRPHNTLSSHSNMAHTYHNTHQMGTQAFDATLGFPGEGPQKIPIRLVEQIPPPKHHQTVIRLLRQLLRMARQDRRPHTQWRLPLRLPRWGRTS